MKNRIAFFIIAALAPQLAGAEFKYNTEIRTRQELTLVALGKQPADLIIRGADVLDVFTLTWRKEQDIVIVGERIAWVGDAKSWPGRRSR